MAARFCQKPDVLRMFLFSLEKLSTSTLAVQYMFIDDNTDPASSKLLHRFAEKHPGQVEIIRSQEPPSTYTCNETTHVWTDELVWRVAGFKDQLIARAKEGDYDGLFLLDSDLLLQPATLETLVASEKDIVSEIFWTSWTPDSLPVPQVWLTDQYTQYELKHRLETLTAEEQYLRKYAFTKSCASRPVRSRRPRRLHLDWPESSFGWCQLFAHPQCHVLGRRPPFLHQGGRARLFFVRGYPLPCVPSVSGQRFSGSDRLDEANLRLCARPRQNVPNSRQTHPRPKITLSMVIHNEADKHLAQVLKSTGNTLTKPSSLTMAAQMTASRYAMSC